MRHSRTLVTALVLATIVGCSSFGGRDAKPDDSTVIDGDGGVGAENDGSGPAVPPAPVPEGCDPGADAKASPACITDGYGIFVDPTNGDDARSGTKAAPVKTIGAAIGKLGGRPRIYLCEGTLAEHVELKTAVSFYGGFACGTWSYTGKHAAVAPADVGYALRISGVGTPMVIADVDFTAAEGTAAAPSSIAAFIATSPMVTLRRVTLTAQNAANGANGAAGAPGTLVSSTPIAGTPNASDSGGTGQTCTCSTGAVTTGGSAKPAKAQTAGEPAYAIVSPPGADGLPAPNPQVAHDGSDAPAGPFGAGALVHGHLGDDGFHPEPGSVGGDGPVGQGGGSAGRTTLPGTRVLELAGGGGGCGGCGGHKGSPGAGGGASAALVTLESPVRLEACALSSAAGGTGGTGGSGGGGIAGGTGRPAQTYGKAGGSGGRGGEGGAGGGGAGGISAGLVFKGAKPVVDATIITGAAGAKGEGGVPGTNDGIDGVKVDVLPMP